MNIQNVRMKNAIDMNPSQQSDYSLTEFIQKYSLNNSNHIMYTSLIQPKQRFSFKRDHQNEFMQKYCGEIQSGNTNLGITELPLTKMPVIIDIDLNIPISNLHDRVKLYSMNNVTKTISIIQSALKQISPKVDDNSLMCILLEKPGYTNRQNTSFKNGFHLHFPNFIIEKYIYQKVLYPMILEEMKKVDCYSDIFNYDGVTINYVYEKIFDPACFRNPWLMYGSRKEDGAHSYSITAIVTSDLSVTTEDDQIHDKLKHVSTFWPDGKPVHFVKPVQYYYPIILSIHSTYKEPNEIAPKFLCDISVNTNNEAYRKNSGNTPTRDSKTIEKDMEVARSLVGLLKQDRADVYAEWSQIGWLIYNISGGTREGYKLWIEFSQRSDKFDEEQCEKFWLSTMDKGLSIGSLCYYAQLDSPKEYMAWKKSRIVEQINVKTEIFKYTSHHDIARILYDIYKSKYVCASITNRSWYEFSNHRWKRIEGGSSLRAKITKDIEDIMITLEKNIQEHLQRAMEISEKNPELEEGKKLIKIIRQNIKNAPFKNNVMVEAAELFYNENFHKQLDANPYLIGYKKGVIDLKNNVCRDCCPDDYISMQMNIECQDFNENDPEVQNVYKFLEQIFPDYTIRQFMLDTYCDVFIGGNPNKYVMFWSGEGNNGKSITEGFFEKMLGDYAIKLPTSLLIGKRTQSSSAAPELVRAGNGVRWALLQEPDQQDVINIGILKELSGNDTIYARGLYKEGCEIKPMFKLVLVCNEPPKIPYSDKATWNRIRIVPFESTFTDDAPDDYGEQLRLKTFKKDKDFEHKCDGMVEAFAWIFLNHRRKRMNDGIHDIIFEPEKVMLATHKYRSRNDIYLQYIEENICNDPTGMISLTAIYTQFKEWFKDSVTYGSVPSKADVKSSLSRIWGEPMNNSWSGKAIKIYEDSEETVEVVL